MLQIEPWLHAAAPAGALRLSFDRSAGGERDWAIWLPGTRRPEVCVVVMHGYGSGGDQLFTRKDVRELWLPAFQRMGISVLSPHQGIGHWMGPAAARDLHWLLGEVRRQYGVKQFHLVGGSMGGGAVLIYAVLHPEDVTSVAALCPQTDLTLFYAVSKDRKDGVWPGIIQDMIAAYGGTPEERPAIYAAHSPWQHADRLTMPTLVIHGDNDIQVPVAEARRLAAAMRAGGNKEFTYIEAKGGSHEVHLHPAANPFCVEWLEKQVVRSEGK